MKWWVIGNCVVAANVVPVYVNWLRHRPHRLIEGTQHIVMAGSLAQLVLLGLATLVWWLA
jgi:hypothetical protein